ncbi:MAG TPA: glycosyltransferase family 4 protein [Gemmatimonadales bacterium]|nr:glycosyltransferase family 4 protein [Gemmatimonadales bacterium]
MSRRYRVAMIAACPFPYPRGTPIRIHRMAEALTRRGHEVHVLTYHLGQDDQTLPFAVHRIPRVASYRKVSPGPSCGKLTIVDPMLVMTVRRFLATHAIDLIHAHHYEGLLVARCARRGRPLPIVYDAHTLLETELPYYPLGLPRDVKRAIGKTLDRWIPRRSDYVIAVTENIKAALVNAEAVGEDRVSVVANGVELEAFQPNGRANGKHAPALVFAGNLAPYQRIDLLVRSFRTVVNTRNDARLLVVGSSSLEQYDRLALELCVRDQIQTVPADFRALPAQLAGADVALNPRTACSGVPQKLLNYMAAAKPIVSFAGSGGLLEHGRTGWLVPDGDTEAFGGAVLHMLDEPELAHRLGAAARRHVADHYSWDRSARLVESVYEQVSP